MTLSHLIVKEFGKANAGNGEPMRLDRTQLASAKKHWQSRVAEIPGVQMTFHAGDRDARCRVLCRFLTPDPTQRLTYFRRDEFRIQHDDDGVVSLFWQTPQKETDQQGKESTTFQEQSMVVSSFSQIDDLVDQILKQFHADAAVRRKRERVRALRIQAMESRLGKLNDEVGGRIQWEFKDDQVEVSLIMSIDRRHLWTRSIDSFERGFADLRDDIFNKLND